jgi:hypothetical protein
MRNANLSFLYLDSNGHQSHKSMISDAACEIIYLNFPKVVVIEDIKVKKEFREIK